MLARALSLTPLAALAAVWVGCSSAPPSPHNEGEGPPGEATATTSEAITSNDAISRATQWVTAKLQYCQSANGQPDGDTACSPVCNRQSNAQWDPYRSDCSGFVSWAWGLPAPGRVTGTFAPFDTTVSKTIQASELLPGDACNRNSGGHMVLFEKWVTPGKTAVFMEEPGCSASQPYAHEFTSAVTLNGVDIDIAYEGTTFTAIRYDAMTESPPPDAGAPHDAGSGGTGDAASSSGSSGSGSGSTSSGGTSSGSSGSSGSGGSSGSSGSSSTGSTSSGGGSGAPAEPDAGSSGNGAGSDPQWSTGSAGSGCSVGATPVHESLRSGALVAIGLAFLRKRSRRAGVRAGLPALQ
jgi:uncharacterized membrane protein YgcG